MIKVPYDDTNQVLLNFMLKIGRICMFEFFVFLFLVLKSHAAKGSIDILQKKP